MLITNNALSEASLVGFGSAIAVVLLVISLVPIVDLPDPDDAERLGVSTSTDRPRVVQPVAAVRPRRRDPLAAGRPPRVPHRAWRCVWLFPLAWVVFTAFRPYRRHHRQRLRLVRPDADARQLHLGLERAPTCRSLFLNTLIVADPGRDPRSCGSRRCSGSSFSRFSFKLNIAAADACSRPETCCPPQVIIVPLYRLYLLLPLPAAAQRQRRAGTTSTSGSSLIHIIFQTGLLHVRPQQLHEDDVEGADGGRAGGRRLGLDDLPARSSCRSAGPPSPRWPMLEFTFIYNDFFWALFLMKTGEKRPVTSALNNLQGAFFTDNNLLAAAALHRRHAHDHRVLRAPEAVRPRPDAGVDEGLTRPPAIRQARVESRALSQTASRTKSHARKSPQCRGIEPVARRATARRPSARPRPARRRCRGRASSVAGQPLTR